MNRAALLVIGLASCSPTPIPPAPAPRASVVQACASLARLGCQEGTDGRCASSMEHALTGHLILIDPSCLNAATSKAGVRACGPAVACP